MNSRITGSIEVQTLFSFAGGVFLLAIVLILPALVPEVQGTWQLDVTLALAAAATAAAIPRFVNLLFGFKAKNGCVITIAGGFVIFLVVLRGPIPAEVTKLVIEVALLVFTWVLIRYGAEKYELKTSRTTLALVTALILLSQVALYSQTSGHDNELGQVEFQPPVKKEVCLRGKWQLDEDGDNKCVGNNQKVWSPRHRFAADVACTTTGLEGESCAQVQFKVFWLKWGDWPPGDEESLSARSYTGHLLYEIDERCQAHLLDSSLKPGDKPSSWLVGFIEIPFLSKDSDLRWGVEKFAQEQMEACTSPAH